MIAQTSRDEWFKRHFYVFLTTTLIESNQHGYANQEVMDQLEDVERIRNLNWCEFVHQTLIKTHRT